MSAYIKTHLAGFFILRHLPRIVTLVCLQHHDLIFLLEVAILPLVKFDVDRPGCVCSPLHQ